MKRVFLSGLLLTITLSAQAFEETWQAQLPAARTWIVIHDESVRHFVVDTFKQTRGELQDLVQSRTFANLSEAKQFAHQERTRLAPQNQWRFVDESNRDSTEALTRSFNEEVAAPPLPPLWEVKHAWSWEWEEKYAKWIRENVTTTFFLDHQIATDCADVAFALRWIFSRIHGLPAVNHLAGSGDLFTHASNREDWLALPTSTDWHQDQRFRAALNYLLRNSSTHTLAQDTYPIALTQEALIEGTIRLYVHDVSGHTQVWGRVDRTGELPVEALESTTPRALRELILGLFTSQPPVKGEGGLMRPLWAELTPQGWGLRLPLEMPYFSEEQYDPTIIPEDADFTLMLLQRVNPAFDPGRVVEETMNIIDAMIEQRTEIVKQGYLACQTQDCSPGTPGWESWSTPNRDTRLRENFRRGLTLTQRSSVPEVTKDRWKNWLNTHSFLIEGKKTPLSLLFWLILNGALNPDPRVEPARRWNHTPRMYLENRLVFWSQFWDTRQARALSSENPCVSSPQRESIACAPGGESYSAWNTAQEDNQLGSLFEGIVATRKLFPDEADQVEWDVAFQSILETPDDQHEWRRRVFHLNSDPRAPHARRRGDPIPELPHTIFKEQNGESTSKTSDVAWRDSRGIVEWWHLHSMQKEWPFLYLFSERKFLPFLPELASDHEWVIATNPNPHESPLFGVTGIKDGRALARLYDLDENLLAEVSLPIEAATPPSRQYRVIHLNPLDPFFACSMWASASTQGEPMKFLIDFRNGTATSVKECVVENEGPPVVTLQDGRTALITRRPGEATVDTTILSDDPSVIVIRALSAQGGAWVQFSSRKALWVDDQNRSPIEIQGHVVAKRDSLFHAEGRVFIQHDVSRKNVRVFEINPESGRAQVLQHLSFQESVGFQFHQNHGAIITGSTTNFVQAYQWKEKSFHQVVPNDPDVTIHSAPSGQEGPIFYFFGKRPDGTDRLYRWDSQTTTMTAISPVIPPAMGGMFGFLRSVLTLGENRVVLTVGSMAWLLDVTAPPPQEWGPPLLSKIPPVVSASHHTRSTAHISRWNDVFFTGITVIDQAFVQNVLSLWRQSPETPAH